MRIKIFKVISVVVAVAFTWESIGWTAPGAQSSVIGNLAKASGQLSVIGTQSSVKPARDFYIPEQYGSIEHSAHPIAYDTKRPSVVLIKDAHCNYEAQTNIGKILETLIRDYKIDLVCVEGAEGLVDTSILGAYPDKKKREQVADKYSKKGYLTASEALSIAKAKDLPFTIYGVENTKLYLENFKEFRNTNKNREETCRYINVLSTLIGSLKNKIFNEKLLDFDKKSAEYTNNKLGLTDWVKFMAEQFTVYSDKAVTGFSLRGVGPQSGMPIRTHKNFNLVLRSIALEEKIDFKNVERERELLIKGLEKQLTKEDLKELIEKSLLFKLGKISSLNYYEYIEQYIAYNLQIKTYNLKKYIHLLKLQSKIASDTLFNEIEQIENSIRDNLYKNKIEKQLNEIAFNLQILSKLYNLNLSRKELEYYKNNKSEFLPSNMLSFILIQAKANNINISQELEDKNFMVKVEQFIQPAEYFYEKALERDSVLVDNLLKNMETGSKNSAVMVAGGFHAEGVIGKLKEKDISCVVITPKITKIQEDCPYLEIMMDKKIDINKAMAELGIKNLSPAMALSELGRLFYGWVASSAAKEEIGNKTINQLLEEQKGVDSNRIKALFDLAGIEISKTTTLKDIFTGENSIEVLKSKIESEQNKLRVSFLIEMLKTALIVDGKSPEQIQIEINKVIEKTKSKEPPDMVATVERLSEIYTRHYFSKDWVVTDGEARLLSGKDTDREISVVSSAHGSLMAATFAYNFLYEKIKSGSFNPKEWIFFIEAGSSRANVAVEIGFLVDVANEFNIPIQNAISGPYTKKQLEETARISQLSLDEVYFHAILAFTMGNIDTEDHFIRDFAKTRNISFDRMKEIWERVKNEKLHIARSEPDGQDKLSEEHSLVKRTILKISNLESVDMIRQNMSDKNLLIYFGMVHEPILYDLFPGIIWEEVDRYGEQKSFQKGDGSSSSKYGSPVSSEGDGDIDVDGNIGIIEKHIRKYTAVTEDEYRESIVPRAIQLIVKLKTVEAIEALIDEEQLKIARNETIELHLEEACRLAIDLIKSSAKAGLQDISGAVKNWLADDLLNIFTCINNGCIPRILYIQGNYRDTLDQLEIALNDIPNKEEIVIIVLQNRSPDRIDYRIVVDKASYIEKRYGYLWMGKVRLMEYEFLLDFSIFGEKKHIHLDFISIGRRFADVIQEKGLMSRTFRRWVEWLRSNYSEWEISTVAIDVYEAVEHWFKKYFKAKFIKLAEFKLDRWGVDPCDIGRIMQGNIVAEESNELPRKEGAFKKPGTGEQTIGKMTTEDLEGEARGIIAWLEEDYPYRLFMSDFANFEISNVSDDVDLARGIAEEDWTATFMVSQGGALQCPRKLDKIEINHNLYDEIIKDLHSSHDTPERRRAFNAIQILKRHEYVEHVLGKSHAIASAVDRLMEGTAYHDLMYYTLRLMSNEQLLAIKANHPNDPGFELFRAAREELTSREIEKHKIDEGKSIDISYFNINGLSLGKLLEIVDKNVKQGRIEDATKIAEAVLTEIYKRITKGKVILKLYKIVKEKLPDEVKKRCQRIVSDIDTKVANIIAEVENLGNWHVHGTNGYALMEMLHKCNGKVLPGKATRELGIIPLSGENGGVSDYNNSVVSGMHLMGHFFTAITYAMHAAGIKFKIPNNVTPLNIDEIISITENNVREYIRLGCNNDARVKIKRLQELITIKERFAHMTEGERERINYLSSIPIVVCGTGKSLPLPRMGGGIGGGESAVKELPIRIVATTQQYIDYLKEMLKEWPDINIIDIDNNIRSTIKIRAAVDAYICELKLINEESTDSMAPAISSKGKKENPHYGEDEAHTWTVAQIAEAAGAMKAVEVTAESVAQEIASIVGVELGRTVDAKDIENALAKAGAEKVTLSNILQKIRGDLNIEQVISIGDRISQLESLQILLGENALQNGGQLVLAILETIVEELGEKVQKENGETVEDAFRRALTGLGIVDAESDSIFNILKSELTKVINNPESFDSVNFYEFIKTTASAIGMSEEALLRAYVSDFLGYEISQISEDSLKNMQANLENRVTGNTFTGKAFKAVLVNSAIRKIFGDKESGKTDEEAEKLINAKVQLRGLVNKMRGVVNHEIQGEDNLDSPLYDVIMRFRAYKELKEGKKFAEAMSRLGNDKAVKALGENTEFVDKRVPEQGMEEGLAQVSRFSEAFVLEQYFAGFSGINTNLRKAISIPVEAVFTNLEEIEKQIEAGNTQAGLNFYAGLRAFINHNPNTTIILQTGSNHRKLVNELIKQAGYGNRVIIGEKIKTVSDLRNEQKRLNREYAGNVSFTVSEDFSNDKDLEKDIRKGKVKVFFMSPNDLKGALPVLLVLNSAAANKDNKIYENDRLSESMKAILEKLGIDVNEIIESINRGVFFIQLKIIRTAEILKGYQLRRVIVDIAA